jgi:hypothetical protein
MKVVGALLGTMSGSMGGMTASHNRGGQYMRQRVVPVSPNTTRQQATKARLGSAVNSWTNVLTPAERAAWETYAANTPRTDSLGNELVLTGQQAYIGANAARAAAGIAAPVDAPTIFNTGAPPTAILEPTTSVPNQIQVSIAGDSVSFELAVAGGAADDGDVLVFMGPPLNPTINFFKGPYQFSGTDEVVADEDPVIVVIADTAFQGADFPVEGQFRPVRVRIAYDDGRTTQEYRAICEVTVAAA